MNTILLLLLILVSLSAAILAGFVLKLPLLAGATRRLLHPGRSLWSLLFISIAVAAACISVSELSSWSPGLYKLWYITGELFPFALLGQGFLFLVAGKKVSRISLVILLVGSAVALFLVLSKPVDGGLLNTNGISSSIHMASWLFNTYGFLAVVFSFLWIVRDFFWNGGRRSRVLGALIIFTGYLSLKAVLAQFGSGLPQPIAIASGIATIGGLLAGLILAADNAVDVALTPEQLHRRRYLVKAGSIGFGATALLGAVALLPVFPFLMGINTNFKSVYISTLPTEKDFNGVFLVTDQGDMQVYSWNIEPDDFPTDAPALDSTSVRQLVVIQSQFDVPENYQLHNLTTGAQVRWQSISQDGRNMTFFTDALDPGDYEFISPTDSMYGGSTYEFFTLK